MVSWGRPEPIPNVPGLCGTHLCLCSKFGVGWVNSGSEGPSHNRVKYLSKPGYLFQVWEPTQVDRSWGFSEEINHAVCSPARKKPLCCSQRGNIPQRVLQEKELLPSPGVWLILAPHYLWDNILAPYTQSHPVLGTNACGPFS